MTNDVPRRLDAHGKGSASRYTRSRLPVTLIYQEPVADRSAALKREAQIKKLTRQEKLALGADHDSRYRTTENRKERPRASVAPPMAPQIPRRIVESVLPSPQDSRAVAREFRLLFDRGAKLRVAGEASRRPRSLQSRAYTPRHKIELFDTTYYLANVRQNEDIRFFVAYVVQPSDRNGSLEVFPRIFYKDISLVWRSASHFVRTEDENWIGKGDVEVVVRDGEEMLESVESTTDLPLEIQTALETLIRDIQRVPYDDSAIALVLRRGPSDRIEPYRDFSAPRRRAQSNSRNLVNRGRSIARFTRKNDPTSLVWARGCEPDFARGLLEKAESNSRMYGGVVKRFRFASRNRKVQHLFFAGPRQVWIAPPQATTTEIMSYGVRTIDVIADENLSIPAYEYHSTGDGEDENGVSSQIPAGFAGAWSEVDDSRADASPWLDRMPIVREFRRKILGGRRRRG